MASNLNIPESTSTVTIRMIDTTGYGKAPAALFFQGSVPGREVFAFPSFAFLITNDQTNEHIIFDLGIRKDWRTGYPPSMYNLVGDAPHAIIKVYVEKDIRDILEIDHHFPLFNISTAIWSHHHFDHIGDMTLFPSTTKLIIGPGMRAAYPTYPSDETSSLHETQFEGRQVLELSSSDLTLSIGDYPAYDLFGDGSFYLLSSPGHTAGHLCGLARVTSSPERTFVLLGGDCCHHPAQFRPSPVNPLPDSAPIQSESKAFSKDLIPGPPSRINRNVTVCPGAYIQANFHPGHRNDAPFYDVLPEPLNYNYQQACESRDKMMVFDADPNILVIIAHDSSVLGVLPFYPETLNGWKAQGLGGATMGRWEFLGEFDLDESSK